MDIFGHVFNKIWPIFKKLGSFEKTHSGGPEIVNHNEFWQFLEISWRFSLFTNFLIVAALVVKLGIWAISGKIAINLPKIAKIHYG